MLNVPTLALQGPPEGGERDKEPEETLEEEIAEIFPNMGKQTLKSRKHRDPTQNKPKQKDTKTHSNQIDKHFFKKKILKATRNIQGNPHIVIS